MLTKLKKRIQQMLKAEASLAHQAGLTPNAISVIGFVLALCSAVVYAITPYYTPWFLIFAAVLLLASGFCDTLDGAVARTSGEVTQFGGFFDSVLDRYADVTIFAGIIIAGLSDAALGSYCGPIFGLAALSGSVLVSYTRARAEVAGIKMESIGLAERAERMVILSVSSIVGYFWLPGLGFGVALLAILSNLTAIQRIIHVFRELRKEKIAVRFV